MYMYMHARRRRPSDFLFGLAAAAGCVRSHKRHRMCEFRIDQLAVRRELPDGLDFRQAFQGGDDGFSLFQLSYILNSHVRRSGHGVESRGGGKRGLIVGVGQIDGRFSD